MDLEKKYKEVFGELCWYYVGLFKEAARKHSFDIVRNTVSSKLLFDCFSKCVELYCDCCFSTVEHNFKDVMSELLKNIGHGPEENARIATTSFIEMSIAQGINTNLIILTISEFNKTGVLDVCDECFVRCVRDGIHRAVSETIKEHRLSDGLIKSFEIDNVANALEDCSREKSRLSRFVS